MSTSISFLILISLQLINGQECDETNNKAPVIMDNLISMEQCISLIGYFESNVDPMSKDPNRFYNGRIVYYRNINDSTEIHRKMKETLKVLVLNAMELIIDHYNIKQEIYPDSIHLVKWYPGQYLYEHSDAFYLNGTAHGTSYRKYSMVVYLNSNFDGGKFQFTKRDITISPECGTFVGFTAGLDDTHLVTEILKGHRYTIACWFTHDQLKSIQDYIKK